MHRPGKAKSVILLYLLGGAATQDMIDLKPNAPREVRGEFKPIATSVPGIQVCEHLPRMSRWMHKIALVRSLNHRSGCHNPLPSYTGLDQLLPDIVSTARHFPSKHGLGVRMAEARPARAARLRVHAVPSRLGPGHPPPRALRRLSRPTLRCPVHRGARRIVRRPARRPPPAGPSPCWASRGCPATRCPRA